MHEPEGQRRPRASRSPLRLAAAIGLVVSLLLVPVVFAGRAVLTDQVSTTSAAITSRLATGSSIVATASRSVATAIDKATAVAEAADAVADRLASPLVTDGVDEAYGEFESSYDAAATAVDAAMPAYETLADPPDGGLAEGLRDRLAGAGDAVRDLKRRIAELPATAQAQVAGRVAGVVASAARQVASTLAALGAVLNQALTQLDTTRERIDSEASEIVTATTVVVVAAAAWLIYTAVLNAVLLRSRR